MQKSKKGSRFQIAEGIGEKEPGGREKVGIEVEERWIIGKFWCKGWDWRIVQENRCKWTKGTKRK